MRRHQRLVIMVAMYLIGMAGNYHPVEAAFDENLTEYSFRDCGCYSGSNKKQIW